MPTLSRRELYDLVWAHPMRTLAQQFGMSDVGLKKHCFHANIPVPERGYWARVAAGKKPQTQALPPRAPGASDQVQIGRSHTRWNVDLETRLAEPFPPSPSFEETLEAVRARAAKALRPVKLCRDLSNPHNSLRKLLDADLRRAEKALRDGWSWDKPLFAGGFERRRLRILNSLAYGLSSVGARLDIRGQAGRELIATVGATQLELALDHPKAKPDRHGEWPAREGPEDDLRLVIAAGDTQDYTPVWADDERAKLEGRLSEIVLEVVVAGEAEYRRRKIQHHAWQLAERARLEAERERRRKEVEQRAREQEAAELAARREHLLGQAAAWRSAQDIRGFVAEILASSSTPGPHEAIRSWAEWALAEADALDPVAGGKLDLPGSKAENAEEPGGSA